MRITPRARPGLKVMPSAAASLGERGVTAALFSVPLNTSLGETPIECDPDGRATLLFRQSVPHAPNPADGRWPVCFARAEV
jgi:hypothetical protein